MKSGRALLTAVGTGIGVFAVVMISVLGETGSAKIAEAASEMGINSVMVQAQPENRSYLSDDDIAVLSEIDGVRKATPLLSSYTESVIVNDREDSIVWGINEDAKDIISLYAMHGRLIDKSDVSQSAEVCVVDAELAEKAYGRTNIVGKNVRLFLGGSYRSFEVIGVAGSGVSTLQNTLSGFVPHFVYIPCSTMSRMTGKSEYDKIAVLTAENADSEQIAEKINRSLAEMHGEADGISVNNLQQHKGQLDGIMQTVKILLALIAGISLLVSGINVMTSMTANVSERRREIGIKKAVGAKDGTLAAEFLGESLVITTTGSVCGVAAGFAVSSAVCLLLGYELRADFAMIFAAVIAAAVIGAAFTLYPAMKAATMPPVEALK